MLLDCSGIKYLSFGLVSNPTCHPTFSEFTPEETHISKYPVLKVLQWDEDFLSRRSIDKVEMYIQEPDRESEHIKMLIPEDLSDPQVPS